jgi:hypothetical protein
VVTLAVVLKRTVPPAGKGPGEEANRLAGEVEGLGRQGKWEQARDMAKTDRFGSLARFRAVAALAFAGGGGRGGNPAADADEALHVLENSGADRTGLGWVLLRLVQVAVEAGLNDDRVQALAQAIIKPNLALRGRAQLARLQARLASNPGDATEADAEAVEQDSVAGLLAWMAVARHNTRRDGDWAGPADTGPRHAFVLAGAALGLQDRDKGR